MNNKYQYLIFQRMPTDGGGYTQRYDNMISRYTDAYQYVKLKLADVGNLTSSEAARILPYDKSRSVMNKRGMVMMYGWTIKRVYPTTPNLTEDTKLAHSTTETEDVYACVYVVMKGELTEGRGPYGIDSVFTDPEQAHNYVMLQPGIMGRKQDPALTSTSGHSLTIYSGWCIRKWEIDNTDYKSQRDNSTIKTKYPQLMEQLAQDLGVNEEFLFQKLKEIVVESPQPTDGPKPESR